MADEIGKKDNTPHGPAPVQAEDSSRGSIGLRTYYEYFKQGGGRAQGWVLVPLVSTMLLAQLSMMGSELFLTHWIAGFSSESFHSLF